MPLKVLVCVKRVVDYNIKIRVKSDHSGVETANVKMAMNPFDEIAVEQAVQLKEQAIASELLVVSIGSKACEETLRTALAMGIDQAIHIDTDQQFEPINIAKILRQVAIMHQPDLILLGKQAIDDDANQTGQMLAALLGWPQATFASKIVISDNNATVTREVDGGLETLELLLPAVITADLRLNTPRYLSLPNIMKAKQKPLKTLTIETLPLTLSSHSKVTEVFPPAQKKAGTIVTSVQELVAKLHNEAKVI